LHRQPRRKISGLELVPGGAGRHHVRSCSSASSLHNLPHAPRERSPLSRCDSAHGTWSLVGRCASSRRSYSPSLCGTGGGVGAQ
jgi:hypothetical protein